MKPKRDQSGKKLSKKGIEPTRFNSQSSDATKGCCANCQVQYGASDDPKVSEEWLDCIKFKAWFHESCAEECGVLDDLCFTCKDCV